MNDSYVSSVIDSQDYQLEQKDKEIAQLKARVAEVRERMETLREFINSLPIDSMGDGYSHECGRWPRRDEAIDMLTTIINRTPAQSLAAHDAKIQAQALEDMVTQILSTGGINCIAFAEMIEDKIAELRQQAKGE